MRIVDARENIPGGLSCGLDLACPLLLRVCASSTPPLHAHPFRAYGALTTKIATDLRSLYSRYRDSSSDIINTPRYPRHHSTSIDSSCIFGQLCSSRTRLPILVYLAIADSDAC